MQFAPRGVPRFKIACGRRRIVLHVSARGSSAGRPRGHLSV